MRLAPTALLAGLMLMTLLGAPAALAKDQKFAAGANGQISFMMPSGNVGCVYTPKGGTTVYEPKDGGPEISCDRVEPSYVNVVLGPKGAAIVTENPGEQSCCGADNVFAYGNTVHFDGFMCSSSTGGLTCETADKRHGFCVAKSRMLHY